MGWSRRMTGKDLNGHIVETDEVRVAARAVRQIKLFNPLRIAVAALSGVVVLAGLAGAGHAQSRGASYLPPFPEGDAYNLLVIGDDFSYGLRHGLVESMQTEARVKLLPRPLHFSGVLRANLAKQVKRIEATLTESKIAIVVMMVGARDAVAIRDQKGKRFRVGTDVWNKEYARRIDQLMAVFKKKSVAVYWVGLPVTSRYRRNESYRAMNDILRDRAFRNGLKFIDIFVEFGDAQERFSPYGPDVQGETRLLRSRDGIFFTGVGNQKLAHFVERKLRRDLKQAKQDRQIPLAGSATEQARIHAGRRTNTDKTAAAENAAVVDERAVPTGGRPKATSTLGEQKQDHGKISLRLRKASGEEETVAVDILRPTIPASVISLMTRRANPDKRADIGDTLIDNIPHGLTVMSSITPSVSSPRGGRRVLSPTQTPFFRVMVKGETLAPVAGRVDDFSWRKPKATAAN